MGIPTWSSGQLLTSSDVDTWFVPLAAYKTADTARNTTTSQTADPHLTLSVAANAVYRVDLALIYKGGSGGSAGFFQWDFDVPSSAVFPYVYVYQDSSGTTQVAEQAAGTSGSWANTTGLSNILGMTITGTLVVSSTPGTFDLKWAQHTSSSTATTLLTNSYMTAQRIA